MSNDESEWNFKVDEEPKKKKKKVARDSSKPREKVKLQVSKGPSKKKARTSMAKREAAIERLEKIRNPDIKERLFASLFDLGIIIACFVAAKMISPFSVDLIIEKARELSFNLDYSPKQILDYALMAIFGFLALLLYLLPTLSSKRSPGKKIMKIRIGPSDKAREASSFQQILREILLKPISTISIIGVLILFSNKDKRSLHDILSGTTLYLED